MVEAERARTLSWWWFEEGRRFGLQAELPAGQGAIVARAIERIAEQVPAMPHEEEGWFADARRADALVALCSAQAGDDPDPDRATVVIHAQLHGLQDGSGGCEIENGPTIHPDTVRRFLCNARVQSVVEDAVGQVLGVGRMSREPSAWMIRQDPLPRSRMPIPGLRITPFHRGTSCPVVALRRSHRPPRSARPAP